MFNHIGYLPLLHTLVEERVGERRPFSNESPAFSLSSKEFEMHPCPPPVALNV
jgi:hypothetical protein